VVVALSKDCLADNLSLTDLCDGEAEFSLKLGLNFCTLLGLIFRTPKD
jgi:hypothetical protein